MLQDVKQYYSETLKNSDDLQTNACCTGEAPPEYIKAILSKIHDEVASRYYGCGLVIPEQLDGLRVLDLGCGSGRDCYTLSALVGATGSVVGVDMTPEQLAVANAHRDFHADIFNHAKTNVSFFEGELEHLDALDLPDNSFDLIVSNCVINLCSDKQAVLAQAYRLLKPGGEMYFSDVYADRRIPQALQTDPVLYGECLSGALYWNDFQHLAKNVGFIDPRLVKDSPIVVENENLEEKLGNIVFNSATYRLFKLPELDNDCEDYGQAVIYKGSIEHHPHHFQLDKHHLIQTGKVFPVCGNTYRMLYDTRFKKHFDFIGDWNTHYGIFDGCGKSIPFTTSDNTNKTTCC